jgi:hypothetical protein
MDASIGPVIDSLTRLGWAPMLSHATNTTKSSPNGTASSSSMPDMVDSFLLTAGQASPLLQIILFVHRLIGTQLGLDPTLLLTYLGFAWGLSKILTQVYLYLYTLVDRYFKCSMFLSEHDHIHSHFMKFLAQQPSLGYSRALTAQTVWKSAWEEEEELESALLWTDGGMGDGQAKYLNFSNQAARSVSDGPIPRRRKSFHLGISCRLTAFSRVQDSSPLWGIPYSGTTALVSW